jgi:hypothetical protein
VAERVNQIGHDFLSSALSPVISTETSAGAIRSNGAHDGLHLRALENRGGIATDALEGIDQFAVFLRLLFSFDGPFHEIEEAFVMRLGMKMKSAPLSGFNRQIRRSRNQ